MEYANRPEVESWISPYWGTTTPALINSAVALIAAIGITVMIYSLAANRTPKPR